MSKMITNTIREIRLYKINTETNQKKLIAFAHANDSLSVRILNATAETLSFNLEDNEKLEKEYIYR